MKVHDGFLLIDKPLGVTSFDVIRRMRRTYACKKIGHAGTLDPQASGLLILAFGRATRLISYLDAEPKVYRFTVRFGEETDTLDHTGVAVQSSGRIPDSDELRTIPDLFVGVQEQVPPAYSAVKTQGKRAYALARSGETPALKSRRITVHTLRVLSNTDGENLASFEVACSGGTYVRALARDFGRALGTFGHTVSIHRSACGPFLCDNATATDTVTDAMPLLSIPEVLSQYPSIDADSQLLHELAFGRNVSLPQFEGNGNERVLVMNGLDFAALMRRTEGTWYHPDIVGNVLTEEGSGGI